MREPGGSRAVAWSRCELGGQAIPPLGRPDPEPPGDEDVDLDEVDGSEGEEQGDEEEGDEGALDGGPAGGRGFRWFESRVAEAAPVGEGPGRVIPLPVRRRPGRPVPWGRWSRSEHDRHEDRGGDRGDRAGTGRELTGSRWREAGMATAEYAVATLAACGFAGLLLALLRSSEVRGMLSGIIRRALSLG